MKKLSIILVFLIPFLLKAQEVSSFKTSNGESLCYTTYGSGQKVLILYGGPGFGTGVIHKTWSMYFKSSCQLIFFDQRGTGLSKNVKIDSSTINLKMAVNDIEDLRKHLKLEKLVIIGYSWGAGLAMSYAAVYPEKVENMLLISPIGPDLDFVSLMQDNIVWRRTPAETDSLAYWQKDEVIKKDPILASKMVTYYQYIPYFFDHKKGSSLLMELIEKSDFNPLMSSLMWSDLYRIKYDIKENLKKYKGKCTIIRGNHDVIDYKVVCQIKGSLPQTEEKSCWHTGHFVDIESLSLFYHAVKSGLGIK